MDRNKQKTSSSLLKVCFIVHSESKSEQVVIQKSKLKTFKNFALVRYTKRTLPFFYSWILHTYIKLHFAFLVWFASFDCVHLCWLHINTSVNVFCSLKSTLHTYKPARFHRIHPRFIITNNFQREEWEGELLTLYSFVLSHQFLWKSWWLID